jgi:hypothetical protein
MITAESSASSGRFVARIVLMERHEPRDGDPWALGDLVIPTVQARAA